MSLSLQSLPIFDKLMALDHVRALVWIDAKGKTKARRGQARSLKVASSTSSPSTSLEAGESVYVRRFARNDYLAVIFDEDANFDLLKQQVDALATSFPSI